MTGESLPCLHKLAGTVSLLSTLLFLAAPPVFARPSEDAPRQENKVLKLNLLSAGIITTWGVANWNYFQTSPQATNEGWFERDTAEGGADKLGHLYSSYALSRLYAAIYRNWNYADEEAIRLGALSSLGTVTIMELGDSFSTYGFSYEDMLMNCVGATAGYWLESRPEWQRRLDLRVEYVPNFNHFEGDVFTDYEQLKYLLALKAEGFAPLNDTPLRYFELQLGYYARGYKDFQPDGSDDQRERTVYLGLGLNVGKVIEKLWKTRTFDYLQLPYTYLPLDKDLD